MKKNTKKELTIDEMLDDCGFTELEKQVINMKVELLTLVANQIKKSGITNKEAGEIAGVPRTLISSIVNGSECSISFDRLLRIAFAFDIKFSMRVSRKKVA